VYSRLAPEASLIVKNVVTGVRDGVMRAPQNTVGVRITRFEIVGYSPIVLMQGGRIVIPVDRHGQGVTDKKAKKRSLDTGVPGRR
jgi:hypothetical protein